MKGVGQVTKRLSAFVVAVVAILMVSVVQAEAPIIQVVVDGRALQMDVNPVVIDGRVMIPARFIAEALGATVEWDGTNQRVLVTSKEAKAAAEKAALEADSVLVRDLVDLHGVTATTDSNGDLRLTKAGVSVVISVTEIQQTGSTMATVEGHPTLKSVRVFTVGGGSRTAIASADATDLGFLP